MDYTRVQVIDKRLEVFKVHGRVIELGNETGRISVVPSLFFGPFLSLYQRTLP